MNLFSILTIFVILLILLFIYYRYIKDDEELVYLIKGSEPTFLSANKLNMTDDSAFSFSVWIYLTKFESTSEKNMILFRRGRSRTEKIDKETVTPRDYQNDSNYQFKMEFNKEHSQPSLNVIAKLNGNKEHNCVIPTIAIQKWINISVAVRNDVMDVFYNGKLLKHCAFEAPPIIEANADVYVVPNGNIPGQISKLTYYKKYITPQKAWEIYTEGPGNASLLGNLINRYGLKIVFMKNNLETDYKVTL